MELLFNIQNQVMTRTDNQPVIGDSKNYLTARFTFSSDWAGKTKTAQFTKFKTTYDVLLVNDRCSVPWEVLQGSGIIQVNVFAGDLLTVDGCSFPVQVSGLRVGQMPSAATPSLYNQILSALTAANLAAQTANTVKNNLLASAAAGDFDGAAGVSAYAAAVAGGYAGTEADFNTLLAGLSDISAALDIIVAGVVS